MIKQKPMEHIEPEDVSIDVGISSDLGITHEEFVWFMGLPSEDRKNYLQKYEAEKKILEESVQQKLLDARFRGDILVSKW